MPKIEEKRYRCTREGCGYVGIQSTNHYGSTWSWGRANTCPKCPPWAKYSEFGGSTVWECIDTPEDRAINVARHRAQARADSTGRNHVIRHNGDYYEVSEARGPEPVNQLFVEFVWPKPQGDSTQGASTSSEGSAA